MCWGWLVDIKQNDFPTILTLTDPLGEHYGDNHQRQLTSTHTSHPKVVWPPPPFNPMEICFLPTNTPLASVNWDWQLLGHEMSWDDTTLRGDESPGKGILNYETYTIVDWLFSSMFLLARWAWICYRTGALLVWSVSDVVIPPQD